MGSRPCCSNATAIEHHSHPPTYLTLLPTRPEHPQSTQKFICKLKGHVTAAALHPSPAITTATCPRVLSHALQVTPTAAEAFPHSRDYKAVLAAGRTKPVPAATSSAPLCRDQVMANFLRSTSTEVSTGCAATTPAVSPTRAALQSSPNKPSTSHSSVVSPFASPKLQHLPLGLAKVQEEGAPGSPSISACHAGPRAGTQHRAAPQQRPRAGCTGTRSPVGAAHMSITAPGQNGSGPEDLVQMGHCWLPRSIAQAASWDPQAALILAAQRSSGATGNFAASSSPKCALRPSSPSPSSRPLLPQMRLSPVRAGPPQQQQAWPGLHPGSMSSRTLLCQQMGRPRGVMAPHSQSCSQSPSAMAKPTYQAQTPQHALQQQSPHMYAAGGEGLGTRTAPPTGRAYTHWGDHAGPPQVHPQVDILQHITASSLLGSSTPQGGARTANLLRDGHSASPHARLAGADVYPLPGAKQALDFSDHSPQSVLDAQLGQLSRAARARLLQAQHEQQQLLAAQWAYQQGRQDSERRIQELLCGADGSEHAGRGPYSTDSSEQAGRALPGLAPEQRGWQAPAATDGGYDATAGFHQGTAAVGGFGQQCSVADASAGPGFAAQGGGGSAPEGMQLPVPEQCPDLHEAGQRPAAGFFQDSLFSAPLF